MKTVTLLAALPLVTAVTQHAIAADFTPGLPAGVPGECETGFCGTPANNGGGGLGASPVDPSWSTRAYPRGPMPTTQERAPKAGLRKESMERRATLRAARRPGGTDRMREVIASKAAWLVANR